MVNRLNILNKETINKIKSFLEDNKINRYLHKEDNLEITIEKKINTGVSQGAITILAFFYLLYQVGFDYYKVMIINSTFPDAFYGWLIFSSIIGICGILWFVYSITYVIHSAIVKQNKFIHYKKDNSKYTWDSGNKYIDNGKEIIH
jgi:hypothetical protein